MMTFTVTIEMVEADDAQAVEERIEDLIHALMADGLGEGTFEAVSAED